MKLVQISVCIFAALVIATTAVAQNSGKQKVKGLSKVDADLPVNVKNFLETADKFEVFMQARKENGKLVPEMQREFEPNYKADVTDRDTRMSILNSFYKESATDEMGAICYLPSHSIRASKADKIVEIEICFGCRKFYITGALGKFNGTLTHKTEITEPLIIKIIEQKGTVIK